MSGDIVNLRQARKAKARTDKEVKADENRRLHGRTKTQKQADEKAKSASTAHLDGHKLEQDT